MTTPLTREQVNAELDIALAKVNITTAYFIRFEFKSETVFVWTGQWAFVPNNTGDAKLDGNQFEPFIQGTPYDIGSNKFSEQGSDALELTLSLPADLPDELQAASISDDEYLARPVIVWRAVQTQAPGLGTDSTWVWKRIRTGRMDQLTFTQDSSQNIVKLTIEAWAAYISDASQSSYTDQQRFDPTDTSQNWVGSIASGQPIGNQAAPAQSTSYKPDKGYEQPY